MRAVWKDIQYGLRMLTNSPSFTIIAVLTLSLGVGVNTAVFSVINGFFLRPLPGKDNAQLMVVAARSERCGTSNCAAAWMRVK